MERGREEAGIEAAVSGFLLLKIRTRKVLLLLSWENHEEEKLLWLEKGIGNSEEGREENFSLFVGGLVWLVPAAAAVTLEMQGEEKGALLLVAEICWRREKEEKSAVVLLEEEEEET